MVFATTLGLLASLALVRGRFRGKGVIYAMLLSPMIVPTIITAIGLYFFFVRIKATGSILAMALGHTSAALPVVIIIMAATLQGFDIRLEQAALEPGRESRHRPPAHHAAAHPARSLVGRALRLPSPRSTSS